MYPPLKFDCEPQKTGGLYQSYGLKWLTGVIIPTSQHLETWLNNNHGYRFQTAMKMADKWGLLTNHSHQLG